MCEQPAHQINVFRNKVLCAPDFSKFLRHRVLTVHSVNGPQLVDLTIEFLDYFNFERGMRNQLAKETATHDMQFSNNTMMHLHNRPLLS